MLLRAFAKVNLDLRVLGKREDGYHEVRTVLQTIDWSDEIHIEPSDRFEFRVRNSAGTEPDIVTGEDNLVVKAVRAFERVTGETVQAHIELVKHVPAGAGLGGGSADAAVTVLGLERWCKRDLSDAERQSILSSLGSDVPFFAIGGRALGTGRGNEITRMDDDSDYGLVVVHPGVSISTAEAYSWLTVPGKSPRIRGFCAQSVSGRDQDEPRNDFEGVVFARHPRLSGIKDEILRSGARRAALSGSGSALFGIFDSEEAAVRALPDLSSLGMVKAAKPLSRPEYLRRLWGVAKR